jgi:hypothetical protein
MRWIAREDAELKDLPDAIYDRLVKVLETHDFRMYFTPPTEDNEEGDI